MNFYIYLWHILKTFPKKNFPTLKFPKKMKNSPKKMENFPKKKYRPQIKKKILIKIKNFPLGKTLFRGLLEKHYYFILLKFYYSKILL
jgi:hypothetical protein